MLVMATDYELFYNRDENISGAIVHAEYGGLALTPSYGSSVTFKSKVIQYNTDDYYINMLPDSMNNLSAQFDVTYEVDESKAQELAAFIESKNGDSLFEFTPDNSNIYQSMTGVCDSYSIEHMNNQHYSVNAKVVIDQSPNLFNWSGMNFLNYEFEDWAIATEFEKYDVVYYPENSNKLNNFHYCTESHLSSALNEPTSEGSLWDQGFFFEADIGLSNSVELKNELLQFQNSFPLRMKTKDNNASFPISLSYTSISDKQLRSILHFLENKGGYRRFKYQIPSVYDRPKVFYATEWQHTWKYHNSHDLTIQLTEDVLGVIPTET